METPVLYFYAPRETRVNVDVCFRQGLITEWYPRAVVSPDSFNDGASLRAPGLSSTIAWTDVTVSPGASADFPVERGPSHYYAARRTDAAPLQSTSQKNFSSIAVSAASSCRWPRRFPATGARSKAAVAAA
jgi:hypothetical protein